MQTLHPITISLIVAVTATLWTPIHTADAQTLPGGSPRGRAAAGGEDVVWAGPDNPARLGRRADVVASIAVGVGFLPVPDLIADEWTVDLGRVEQLWTRATYVGGAAADEVHWSVWGSSLSVPFAYRGNLAAADEPYRVDAHVGFYEVGGGIGLPITPDLAFGAGLTFVAASVWGTAEGAVTASMRDVGDLVFFPLPRLRIGFEWFPIREVGLTLSAAEGPFVIEDTETATRPYDEIASAAFVGRPPTEIVFGVLVEVSARLHVFGEYRLLLTHAPDFGAHPLPGNIHQVSAGVEYVFVLSGGGTQLALRGGLIGYNLFEGVWDRTAPVYEQFLFVFTVGIGLYLRGFSIDLSSGFVFWPDGVDLDTARIALGIGYRFG